MRFDEIIFFLIIVLISIYATSFLTPFVINLAVKNKIFDYPDSRKIHSKPAIRIGGIAIYFGFIISVSIGILIFSKISNINFSQTELLVSFLLTFLFFCIGFIDDFISISPFKRLFLQILICTFISVYGFSIDSIYIAFLPSEMSQIPINKGLSIIFSTLWISGVVNAINWIDGLDGLAAGIISLSSLTLAIFNLAHQNVFLSIISLGTFGTSIGFLKFNRYPSKIMMGDSGSYFYGSVISLLCLLSFNKDILGNSFNIIPALLILLLPIGDMILVMGKRLKNKSSIFFPDRSHFHHRLLELNLTDQNIVNFLYLVNLWFCLCSLYFLNKKLALVILFFCSILLVLEIKKFFKSNKNKFFK